MRAYKGFAVASDGTISCRGHQYVEGETYVHDGPVEMRDILTHIAGAGDRELFDRLHDRWTSLRYGTRSGPEVPARGRVVSARHTTLRIPL